MKTYNELHSEHLSDTLVEFDPDIPDELVEASIKDFFISDFYDPNKIFASGIPWEVSLLDQFNDWAVRSGQTYFYWEG